MPREYDVATTLFPDTSTSSFPLAFYIVPTTQLELVDKLKPLGHWDSPLLICQCGFSSVVFLRQAANGGHRHHVVFSNRKKKRHHDTAVQNVDGQETWFSWRLPEA